jgi:hypothetical protein
MAAAKKTEALTCGFGCAANSNVLAVSAGRASDVTLLVIFVRPGLYPPHRYALRGGNFRPGGTFAEFAGGSISSSASSSTSGAGASSEAGSGAGLGISGSAASFEARWSRSTVCKRFAQIASTPTTSRVALVRLVAACGRLPGTFYPAGPEMSLRRRWGAAIGV